MLMEMRWSSSMGSQGRPRRVRHRRRGPCLQEQKDRPTAAAQSRTSARTESKPTAQIFLAHSLIFRIREAVHPVCLSFYFRAAVKAFAFVGAGALFRDIPPRRSQVSGIQV